jgi:plasmid maintenance system antidote protein VapI
MKPDSNQLPLIENIPRDAAPKDSKPKKYTNCIAEILHEIMEEKKTALPRVHGETGIPFSTLYEWITGKAIPITDESIMILAKHLNVTLEYLLFGIGFSDSIEVMATRLAKRFGVSEEEIYLIMETPGDDEEVIDVMKANSAVAHAG